MMEDGDLEHMQWQVTWRSKNQECCLSLFKLLRAHEDIWLEGDYFFAAQDMISAAFSLWRAVFLSDKEAKRSLVFKHSKDFLESVILDNAISYMQDKKNNEWTFNYYVTNARYRLVDMHERHSTIVPEWIYKNRKPKPRWVYAHSQLCESINAFQAHLADSP
jgi:hypothetical protein